MGDLITHLRAAGVGRGGSGKDGEGRVRTGRGGLGWGREGKDGEGRVRMGTGG